MKNSMKQINKRTALCAAAFLLALLTLLSACREEPVVHSPSEDVTGASAADAVPTVTVTPSGEASETPAPTPSDTPDPPMPTETSVPSPTPTPTPTPSLTVVLPPRDDAPVITEVMPHNNKYPVAGVFTGYVEFYNPHSQPVTLSDFSLCDTPDAVFAALPSVTLESGRYAVVAAGDLNVLLSRQGKTLYLRDAEGRDAGAFTYPAPGSNTTCSDNGYALPTPGYANSDAGYLAYINERAGLRINEVMTGNSRYLEKDGDTHDMVELFNAGSVSVDLSSYYLSDSRKDLKKYRLPAVTVAPGEYCTVYCDGDMISGVYAPFSLSSEGEFLVLSRADGTVEDAFDVPHIPVDRSWGRGEGGMRYFETPGFGKANPAGYKALSGAPVPSIPGGFYEGKAVLTLSGAGKIFYTTDGSRPSVNSALYKGETLTVNKTATVRALMLEEGKLIGEDVAFDYIIDPYDFELPVVKVTVVDDDLYGEGGIYTDPYYKDKNLEIQGHIAMYVGGVEQFSLNCGVKVHGNYSRKYEKKSLQIKFRSRYGESKLRYDLFNDGVSEYKGFVLRSGSQDRVLAMMRDEFATSLVHEYCPGVYVQKYRPCNVYLNDKYVGVYYIREKIGQNYVAQYMGGSPLQATVVWSMQHTEWGDGGNWSEIRSFFRNHDLSVRENYDYICSKIDIDSLIDYWIALVWADNRDEGNTRIFRTTGGKDDKWHFLFYDNDLGFGEYLKDDPSSAHFILGTYQEGVESKINNGLTVKLLKNADFRDRFLARLGELCKTLFSDRVVNARIDKISALIAHDLRYDPVCNYDNWRNVEVPKLRAYVTGRAEVLKKEFSDLLGLSGEEQHKYFD